MVCAALVTHLGVPPSYAVPRESEKLHFWYSYLVQLLTESIKLAMKGKRKPACCGVSGTELLFTVRSQPSLGIYSKELILGEPSQVRAVAVTM